MGSPQKCIASTRLRVYRAVVELHEASQSIDVLRRKQNKEMAAAEISF